MLLATGSDEKELGFTCQMPQWRAYQQDGSRVEQWLKSEHPRIRALAKREKAEIYFGDGSGVRSDFHSSSTWAARGQARIVRVTGQRFSLNMISAISPPAERARLSTRTVVVPVYGFESRKKKNRENIGSVHNRSLNPESRRRTKILLVPMWDYVNAIE
jgi:hypothetical protein